MESRLEVGKAEKERFERNLNGMRNHFSWCMHCHDTWDWKKPHHIFVENYKDRGAIGGAFPYCEECSGIVSVERKKELVTRLVNWWIGEDPEHVEEHLRDEILLHLAVENGK